MEATKFIEGLFIIQRAKPKKESDFHIRAEHDNVWAGSVDWKLSQGDRAKLEELGWYEDHVCDGWKALF